MFSYFWFLEFTRSGKPHYHVITDIDHLEHRDRACLGYIWADCLRARNFPYCSLKTGRVHTVKQSIINVHSHHNNWSALRKEDGAKRYALKYALKPYQKKVPETFRAVGRFWGCSYDVIPKPVVMDVFATDEQLREYIGKHNPVSEWDVLPKYIFPRSPE